jgi:hypothetical protein
MAEIYKLASGGGCLLSQTKRAMHARFCADPTMVNNAIDKGTA